MAYLFLLNTMLSISLIGNEFYVVEGEHW